MDYKKAYGILFNAMTEAISKIYSSRVVTQEMDEGLEILKKAQQATEEMYMDEEQIQVTQWELLEGSRGNTPLEQVGAGRKAGRYGSSRTFPFRGAKHFPTAAPTVLRWESAFALLSHEKVTKRLRTTKLYGTI